MPAWLALALAIVGGGVALAAVSDPARLRDGWDAAVARSRDRRGRRAALRQLEREGWHRP